MMRERRNIFERAYASSRSVSRDILHTTRSLYRRDHVNELVSKVEPAQEGVQAKTLQVREDKFNAVCEDRQSGAGHGINDDDGADLTLKLRSFMPAMNAIDDYPDSLHRTRPLTPEANDLRATQQQDIHSLFPRPPSLQRSQTQVSTPRSKRSIGLPKPMEQPHHLQSRPSIPPRSDSLPQKRVLINLVDRTTRGEMAHRKLSTQSVTAYVSAEYSETPATPTLTMTSWLSDPDGPPDDLASWNQPVTDQQPLHDPNSRKLSIAGRPQLGTRSKTTPVYSNVVAPPELPDAAYERLLREKLRHHAGQIKKRVDTSAYYAPTVRQNEMEIHLAFVRAAEEILKQSPIWRGAPDESMKMTYLLER